MRLPEATVDAWTSIHLAMAGSQWIWLPTPNQQSPASGSYPWDIESARNRRLLIIENKGVRNSDSIPFGYNSSQRPFLKRLENDGINLVNTSDRPVYGWVMYGLPILRPTDQVDGSSWQRFAEVHHLVCPHDLDLWSVPGIGQRSARKLVATPNGRVDHRKLPLSSLAAEPHPPLTLAWYGHLMSAGYIGLPLPDGTDARRMLSRLRALAGSFSQDGGYTSETEESSLEMPVSEHLTLLLSTISKASRHVVGCVAW